jgi:hypothetical protein
MIFLRKIVIIIFSGLLVIGGGIKCVEYLHAKAIQFYNDQVTQDKNLENEQKAYTNYENKVYEVLSDACHNKNKSYQIVRWTYYDINAHDNLKTDNIWNVDCGISEHGVLITKYSSDKMEISQ